MARQGDEQMDTSGAVDIERDRDLVLRCQAGDSTAFAELYTRYYERLLRFCRRRLADSSEAEDVAQESFVKAWRALPQFAGERRFYPWLTVIAGNLCTDVQRKRSRVVIGAEEELEAGNGGAWDDEESPEEVVVAAADGELAHRALQRLTVRHQRVLALREGSELSYQQIAAREGVDVSAVETLLWRARQALKREFAALSGSSAAGVFGLGLVAALRRVRGRMAHGMALAARRMVPLRGSGIPVREAVVALAVTTAAVTTGAALLHSPHRAGAAAVPGGSAPSVPVVGGSSTLRPHGVVPAVAGGHASSVAPSGASVPSSGGIAPTAGSSGSTGGSGAGTVAAGSPVPTTAGAVSHAVSGAGAVPPVPSLPALPQSPAAPPLPSLTSALTSGLPLLGTASGSAPAGGVSPSTVTGAVGSVGQALSGAGQSASSSLASTLASVSGAVSSAMPGSSTSGSPLPASPVSLPTP